DVVEPLFGDLAAGALPHRLLDVVARPVGEETVDPDADLPGVLLFELSLPVDGPAQQPLRVLTADDAAGDHPAAARVALADGRDVRQDPLVEGGDGGRLPVGLVDVGAELLRPAEGRVLPGDVLPQIPAAAGPHLGIPAGGVVLVAIDG